LLAQHTHAETLKDYDLRELRVSTGEEYWVFISLFLSLAMDFSNPAAIRQAFEHQEQRIATLVAQLAFLSAAGGACREGDNARTGVMWRYFSGG
jgi:hypothetical protein